MDNRTAQLEQKLPVATRAERARRPRAPGSSSKRGAAPLLHELRTVKQLCQEYPHLFTEGSLRWMIFNAETNGFSDCIIRAGRRVLIDVRALREWMARRRGTTGSI